MEEGNDGVVGESPQIKWGEGWLAVRILIRVLV